MSSTSTPMSPKRACDSCHSRKRKCVIETSACQACISQGLECTFDVPPKKKGPKHEDQAHGDVTKGQGKISGSNLAEPLVAPTSPPFSLQNEEPTFGGIKAKLDTILALSATIMFDMITLVNGSKAELGEEQLQSIESGAYELWNTAWRLNEQIPGEPVGEAETAEGLGENFW